MCVCVFRDLGCADITTTFTSMHTQTHNTLTTATQDADLVQEGLMQRGLTAFQTGMDNVRNLTGSPIAGIDPHELIDVRPLLQVCVLVCVYMCFVVMWDGFDERQREGCA